MKIKIVLVLITLFALPSISVAHQQGNFMPTAQHQQLLASSDSTLAANKALVYNFWREVFEAGHLELADKYLTESYIQHNPNVPSGRAGFVDFFSKVKKPQPIEASVKTPLISIVAERDLVILAYFKEYADPKDPAKTYKTTWFDMFRIENGKIAEHWDSALKTP